MKHIIFIFSLFCFPSFGQSLEGKYLGSLIGDQDLILIEKDEDHFLVTLQTGEKTTFLCQGNKKSDGLTFDIPLTEGGEREVFASRKEDYLLLKFDLDNESYEVIFASINKQPKSNDRLSSKNSKDERLIGTWIEKQTFTLEGVLDTQFDNSSKGYKTIYTADGRIIPDTRFFRDEFKKHGLKFELSDIPTYFWSTSDGNILTTHIPSLNQTYQSTYEIRGDSLIVKEEKVKRVFVKETLNFVK